MHNNTNNELIILSPLEITQVNGGCSGENCGCKWCLGLTLFVGIAGAAAFIMQQYKCSDNNEWYCNNFCTTASKVATIIDCVALCCICGILSGGGSREIHVQSGESYHIVVDE